MKSLQTCLSVLLIVFIVAGCAPRAGPEPNNPSQNTEEPSATLMQFTPEATLTPTKSVTPVPPPTRRVATLPTSTVTITPLASFTIQPTSKNSKTPTSTITGTNTLYVRPPGFGGPVWTATPNPFRCAVTYTSPDWGQQFTPRANFIAYWRILNVGPNLWHKDDIVIDYVSGTKMHNREREHTILDVTTYVGGYYNLRVQMQPPKEPGFYTTTWGFRKTNKQEFFCMFDITIQVVKKK